MYKILPKFSSITDKTHSKKSFDGALSYLKYPPILCHELKKSPGIWAANILHMWLMTIINNNNDYVASVMMFFMNKNNCIRNTMLVKIIA